MILYNLIRYIKADFFILKDFSGMVLLSPLSMMFIDGILIFLNLLSPVIFFIILHYKKNSNYFKTYILSVVLIAILNYIFLVFDDFNYLNIVVMSYNGDIVVNKLWLMIPSLIITILINYYIFRRKLFSKK
jgi:hypothetical protein